MTIRFHLLVSIVGGSHMEFDIGGPSEPQHLLMAMTQYNGS